MSAKLVLLSRSSADTLRDVRWALGLSMDECAAALHTTVLDYLAKERGRKPFAAEEFAVLLSLLAIDATILEA